MRDDVLGQPRVLMLACRHEGTFTGAYTRMPACRHAGVPSQRTGPLALGRRGPRYERRLGWSIAAGQGISHGDKEATDGRGCREAQGTSEQGR